MLLFYVKVKYLKGLYNVYPNKVYLYKKGITDKTLLLPTDSVSIQ